MKRTVEVTQSITVEVPDDLLSENFMEDFRKSFYEFDTVEEHLEHLAQLNARGLVHDGSFIEGYGKAGIKFENEVIDIMVLN